MHKKIFMAAIVATLFNSNTVLAKPETESIKQQLDTLKKDYDQRIQALEARLLRSENRAIEAQAKLQQPKVLRSAPAKQSSFNPAISLILDGRYGNLKNNPEDYQLPGFALGGEAGLSERGLAIGHSELIMSANIDDKFYGKITLAIAEHEGETEVELEEAFIQTLGLGNGMTLKAGRFLSEMGYLNKQHAHYWDFADAPLVYRGLFGNQLIDDGLQFTYVIPADTFIQLGAEMLSGSRHPAAGHTNGVGAWTAFVDIGGDIGIESSWQLGLSHWQANDIDGREGGAHEHAASTTETPSFSGNSKISALDLVYKWAPNGNPKNQNFKFQFEYFERREDGRITMLNSGPPLETSTYDGQQSGWYAQTIYQFKPQWRVGLRYDQLNSDNTGSDADVLDEAKLLSNGHTPKRTSAMLEWVPSEFSRVRLQYNRDESYEESDNQLFLQYTMSLGSHGAHPF